MEAQGDLDLCTGTMGLVGNRITLSTPGLLVYICKKYIEKIASTITSKNETLLVLNVLLSFHFHSLYPSTSCFISMTFSLVQFILLSTS